MKKIMLLLGIMAFATTIANAEFNEDNTSDINILRSQGYSESALRVIDTTKALNQHGNYQRHYVPKNNKNAAGKGYTAVKNYFDPIQEDNLFGEHEINFANSWNGDETHYTTGVKDSEVENL